VSDAIPRILITVEGGTVQEVLSDRPVEYLLVDWDNREQDDAYIPEIAEAEIHLPLIDQTFALAKTGLFPFPESDDGGLTRSASDVQQPPMLQERPCKPQDESGTR
jgi:hypothetical protein